jgi:hypothetical protein
MEDLTTFNQGIELSPDAKKLMLGMIRSMQSLMPSGPVLVPEDTSDYNYRFMHYYAPEVLRLSQENEDIFDGIIDPGMLQKYITNTDDLKELGNQLDQLLKAIRKYQNLSEYLSFKLACMMKEYMEMTEPDICKSLDHDLHEINEAKASKSPEKQVNGNLKIV